MKKEFESCVIKNDAVVIDSFVSPSCHYDPSPRWIAIRFGKWNSKANNMFCYTRIYRNGHRLKWTPFCVATFRYVG